MVYCRESRSIEDGRLVEDNGNTKPLNKCSRIIIRNTGSYLQLRNPPVGKGSIAS
jgi:hypothetical protein